MKRSEGIIRQMNFDGCGCDNCRKRGRILRPAVEAVARVLDSIEGDERDDLGIPEFFEMFIVIAGTLVEFSSNSMEIATGQSLTLAERFRSIGRQTVMHIAVEEGIKQFIREHVSFSQGAPFGGVMRGMLSGLEEEDEDDGSILVGHGRDDGGEGGGGNGNNNIH